MLRIWMAGLGVLAGTAWLAGQSSSPPAADRGGALVVRNVTVLDPLTGRGRAVETLLVVRGRVVAGKAADIPTEARVIDAAGRTAVPGLADLAIGVSPGRQTDADFISALGLAHGVMHYVVTDARAPWSFDQQKRVASGEVLSPTLSLAAPVIVSDPTTAPRSLDLSGYVPPTVVREAGGAEAAVRRLADAGYDRIRISGDVPAPVARAVIAAARKRRLSVSVVTGTTSVAEVVGWGPDLVEGLGSFPSKVTVRTLEPVDSWRQARAADVAAAASKLAKSRVTLAPMLRATVRDVPGGKDSPFPFDPDRGLALLPKRAQEASRRGSNPGGADAKGLLATLRAQQAFVKAWAAAGGRLGLASGISQEPWPVPGLAIHEELALLAAADVPLPRLLEATAAPGVDVPGTTRHWADGWSANFFLVDGDPTKDLAALARVTTVIRAGEVLSPETLIAQGKRAIRSP